MNCDTTQILYVQIGPGLVARVSIEIQEEAAPAPLERPTRRKPDVAELHLTAEQLLRRAYQFHPGDGHE